MTGNAPERSPAGPAPVPGLRTALLVGIAFLVAVLVLTRCGEPKGEVVGNMVGALQKHNSLTVFSAQVITAVSDTEERVFGLMNADQTAIIPARVEYKLDLSGMKAGDLSWDEGAQRMEMTLPPIVVGAPNLDEGRARYFRKGLLVSGETQEALTRQNTQAARADALREARKPELMALARAAAREAMIQNVTVPLRAAGFEKVTVKVRFGDEPGSGSPTYLDRSRRMEDVLKERQAKR